MAAQTCGRCTRDRCHVLAAQRLIKVTTVAAHQLRPAQIEVTRSALRGAMTTGGQHEHRVVLTAAREGGARELEWIRVRWLPARRLVAEGAVARQRRVSIGAIVGWMDPRAAIVDAVAAETVARYPAERAVTLPLVARGAVEHRVAPGQRHPCAPMLFKGGGIGPGHSAVALGAGSVVATLVDIAMAPLAGRRRLAARGVAPAALRRDVRSAQREPGAIVIEAASARTLRELPAGLGVTRGAIHVVD